MRDAHFLPGLALLTISLRRSSCILRSRWNSRSCDSP